jgi:hypothetical protein
MKRVIVSIFLTIFLLTANANSAVYADSISVVSEDDKKRDEKRKDPPGPVVVKDKNKKDPQKDKENPRRGKKPDQ